VKKRYDKWRKWFDEIRLDIQSLLTMRHVYDELSGIIKKNPRIQRPSIFYDFLVTVYASSAVIGVRRQIKNKKDSISIARLLDEMRQTPEAISRTGYKALHGGAAEGVDDGKFDEFAGEGNPFVSADLIEADLKKLKSLALKCEDYADRKVAHIDKGGVKAPPTYSDLNMCIGYMEFLLLKYQLLFRKDFTHSFMPVIQGDWKEIFKEPWLQG
jgi:hypothetical protein